MPQLIKCTSSKCSVRYKCKRHTMAPSENQIYHDFEAECGNGSCKYYIHILTKISPEPYPKPDRNGFIPNKAKTPENDALDIGWAEGTLSDTRPYRMECWAQDGVTSVTFFLSTIDLSGGDKKWWSWFLRKEGLLSFFGEKQFIGVAHFTDPSGNEMWSVNVVVGDEDETYVTDTPAINPY